MQNFSLDSAMWPGLHTDTQTHRQTTPPTSNGQSCVLYMYCVYIFSLQQSAFEEHYGMYV